MESGSGHSLDKIIDLDDSSPNPSGTNDNTERECDFVNLVNGALAQDDTSNIRKFNLRCGEYCKTFVNSWMCTAIKRNVQELNLCISKKEMTLLPHDLFNSQTLIVFKLSAAFVLDLPIEVCLPNLKTMRLDKVMLPNDGSIERLISSCPVLEELSIRRCGLENIHVFHISAPSLKRLIMNNVTSMGESRFDSCKYEIVVDAPNLIYLKYIDLLPKACNLKNLQSLVKAYINVDYSHEQMSRENYNCEESVTGLVEGISNVQFLHLFSNFMEVLGLSDPPLPVFSNLTHLVLSVGYSVSWKMQPEILENTPILKTLCFDKGILDLEQLDGSQEDDGFHWDPPKAAPSCLLYHLETIEIRDFHDFYQSYLWGELHYERYIVAYFLRTARVLEKMRIRTCSCCWTKKEKLKVQKELLRIRTASQACRVVFS